MTAPLASQLQRRVRGFATRAAATRGAATLCAGATAAACASQQALLADLERAAVQANLPRVVACYEKHFEQAGFRGEYEAVVSFTVTAGTGALRDVNLSSVEPAPGGDGAGDADDAEALASCLGRALAQSTLGPAFAPAYDVTVVGMRVAFRDASREARAEAAEQTPHVLLGPRANRCDGLYGYDPPREASTLLAELDEATGRAERARADGDDDRQARELQRAYDVALELGERLRLDAEQPDLSSASRARLRATLETTRTTARELGVRIGCSR